MLLLRQTALCVCVSATLAAQNPCRALPANDQLKIRDCYIELAATAHAAGNIQNEAIAWFEAGRAQYAVGDAAGAAASYEKALLLRRGLPGERELGSVLNFLGAAYWSLGENQKALAAYQEVISIRERTGDPFGVALARFGIGNVYAEWGDAENALSIYQLALDRFRELKEDRWIAEALNASGLVFANIGDYPKALDRYQQALALWRKIAYRPGEAYSLNNLGLAYSSMGDSKKAVEYFERALPILREAKDQRGVSYSLNNLGDALAALKQPARAAKLYEESLSIKRQLKDRYGEAHTLERIGESKGSLGDTAEAVARFDEALALHRQVGNRPGEAIALAAKARVERASGSLTAARAGMEQALGVIETLRAQLVSGDLRTSFFSTQHDSYAFFVDLLIEMGDASTAFEVDERGRARGLLDLLEQARIDPAGSDTTLLEKKQALEREMRVLARRGESGAAVNQRIDAALREWNGVDAAIRKSSPRYAGLMPPRPLRLADVQQRVLDPDTALLQFSLGEDRSHAWLITRESMVQASLPGRARIEAEVRTILNALEARNAPVAGESADARAMRIKAADAEFSVQAQVLGAQLLGPFASKLRARRLVIVPDGALNYVPFAAIGLPGGNRRLGAVFELLRAPSASAIAELRSHDVGQPPPRRAVIAIADPAFDPAGEYPRLRFSRAEAESITAAAPGASRMLAGFEASRAAVLGDALRGYRIVHFATHAEIDNEHPALSRIVLSQVDEHGRPRDGYVRLLDIFNMRLDANLVVLSACRSALGKDIRGEGLVGLTRGFFYAGAARVVASLWDVQDRATAALMKGFYERMLKRGMTPAAALRSSQLALAADPRWASPYFWAGFTIVGDWK